MTLQEAFHRFDQVRDEYQGSGFAIRTMLNGYQNDPAVNEAGTREKVTPHHLRSSEENLQITYFVRLFAEFEAVLRDYWLIKPQARDRTAHGGADGQRCGVLLYQPG